MLIVSCKSVNCIEMQAFLGPNGPHLRAVSDRSDLQWILGLDASFSGRLPKYN